MLGPMHQLAIELNKILENTIVERLLSEFGARMYFPKGIAAQSAEANGKATLYNATIGMPRNGEDPMIPDFTLQMLSPLGPTEAVSYAPNGGVPELRSIWTKEILRKNPSLKGKTTSAPTVVAGLTNGIFQISDLFVNPSDRVIVPELFWGNYTLIFEERKNADIVTYPFYTGEDGYNAAGLAAALEGRKKAIVVLNFPNNPTGYSPTRAEAEKIAAVLTAAAENGTDILAVCDDAYFGLNYEDDIYPESLFSLLAGAHPNLLAVKIDGTTKEDFSWGFRIGFVTFGAKGLEQAHYDALNRKLLGAIRSSISSSSRPAQSLLIMALKNSEYEKQKAILCNELYLRYKAAKDFLENEDCAPLVALPFNSGYFMSFSFPGKAEALRLKLLDDYKIGTISIRNDYLRVTYAAVDKTEIPTLFAHIRSAAAELGN